MHTITTRALTASAALKVNLPSEGFIIGNIASASDGVSSSTLINSAQNDQGGK
ncbi:hypothetical protein GCM10017714_19840 [Curtobacterium pusillum]|jgi:hypothetical protein|uniref:Uncharacterized protein n=1 Tax=Curtobacterium pusillum TaxID=69373 RepID=A0AAW3TCR2_9MICO|nr:MULTISPECIES: hypothetical protein [Curtobacterium]MBA8992168.1 hypothetical protein [Curtobacterium pusillum]NUU12331.1 hypothetical protein [Curtobacterium pusillum]ROQ04967.1 hypothetical protein EDF41_3086 [Curtobacterium sp. PhB171]ROQ22168.1 hypothetical protein EDF40_3254 [Curtobacterium sp. PhB170]ROS33528.1 hypothetical protein EDF25_2909 [Curtobacterium sp. PhB131]